MGNDTNSKGFKLNFITLFLFLTFLILTVGGIFLVKNVRNNHPGYTNTMVNNTIMSSPISRNTGIDLSFGFLEMENPKNNMIYSPLSIKYALSMLGEGASGNTKTQIRNVLGDKKLSKYKNIDDVLNLANAIFIKDTFSSYVNELYIEKIEDTYNAEIKFDAFESADNINEWIEGETFGKIKNMVSDVAVTNPDTKMVLVNSLVIDMEWEEEFDVEDTNGETFYLEDGDTMEATTMNHLFYDENVSYYQDDEVTVLSMDLRKYENQQFEFIAIMPEGDLSKYIDNFNSNIFSDITSNMISASDLEYGIEVSIPKFTFSYDLNLKEDLRKLGIVDAFDEDLANFRNMSDDKDLFISDALHKVNIEFSEDGVTASASTVFAMTKGTGPALRDLVQIIIDKPFMFVIRDKKTNEIWFVGSVYKPNSWDDDEEEYHPAYFNYDFLQRAR